MAVLSYDLVNKKRDLADIFDRVVKGQPRFISLFPRKADATQRKHEWLEDAIGGRSVTATAVASMVMTVSADDAKKLLVGMRLHAKGDAALFGITNISTTSITLSLIAANGSSKTAPAQGDVFDLVGLPYVEATSSGEKTHHQLGTAYNCTQIFRKEIELSGTALAVNVYGNIDNQINAQTEYMLDELARDINRCALYGYRALGDGTTPGEFGGLYGFATGLSVNASGAKLDSYLVNDAAAAVSGEGGVPSVILCSIGQARVMSAENKDRLTIVREDRARGAYVAQIINDINGQGMTIIADPDMPDTDAWVLDPAGFGLSNLKGRAIADEDTTPKGYDGIRRTALGEITLEFKNANARCAKIYGLQGSATALANARGAAGKVYVGGGTVSVTGSTVTTINGGTATV